MQFQKINRTDAEIGYGIFTNVDGQTITKGYPGIVCTTSGSNTGYAVTQARTSCLKGFAGIAAADVANTDPGRFICYGYAASVYVFAHGTSVTIVIDDRLGVGAAASLGVGSTGLITVLGPIISLTQAGAAICSPGGYISGFVKAM